MSCHLEGEGITQRVFEELKDAFDMFDRDGDGHISGKELGTVLRVLGQNPTEANVQEVLRKADKNGDEVITFDEYLGLLKDNLKPQNEVETELREAFGRFDNNKDNTLNLMQLQHALMYCGDCLNKDEARAFCKEMDTNGDGKVDIEEFVKYMCKRY